MKQTLVTDKHYVDFGGLKALIDKIGALRKEYIGRFEEGEGEIGKILARLDALIAVDTKGDGSTNVELVAKNYTIGPSDIIQSLLTAIDDVRTELGESNAAGAESVYARLDTLENWVKNGWTDETTGEPVPGLLDRAAKLEAESFKAVRINDLKDENDYRKTNNIHVEFLNAKDEAVGHFDIDTTEFVVDGMLGDIKLISVVNHGQVIRDMKDGAEYSKATATEPWLTLINESADMEDGQRYFVFTFKTTEAGVQTPDFAGQATDLKNIWVSVKDLHDSYVFESENNSENYVVLTAKPEEHTATGATKIVYAVEFTSKSIDAIDLANGDYKVKNGRDKDVRGIVELDEALTASEGAVEKLKKEVEDGWEKEDGTKVPGLLERADVLEAEMENRVEEIEAINTWIKKNTIPAADIMAYFDAVVYGADQACEDARKAADATKEVNLHTNDTDDYFTLRADFPSLSDKYKDDDETVNP